MIAFAFRIWRWLADQANTPHGVDPAEWVMDEAARIVVAEQARILRAES